MSGPSISDQWNSWSSSRNNAAAGNNNNGESIFSSWKDTVTSSANNLYSRLPIYEREEEVQEPSWFKLSRFERIVSFIACILAAVFFFSMSFVLFPVLALKPRKFGLLWSLGSILFVVAFAILNGPVAYLKHMVSKDRIYFSALFLVTVFTTIYFSVVVKSTLLTVISGFCELIAVIYYTVSYFPFGAQTLSMITSTGGRQAISLMGFWGFVDLWRWLLVSELRVVII